MTKKQHTRKVSALARLEAQLKSGVKTKTIKGLSPFKWDIQNILQQKGYPRDIRYLHTNGIIHIKLPLTESNIDRITKEIGILKSKIISL